MDLQRYLADEPVLACPPSAAYRLRKFVRRHKFGLSATLGVLLFVAVIGGVISWTAGDRAARQAAVERERQARRESLEGRVNLALEELRSEYERDNLPEALSRLNRIDLGGSARDISNDGKAVGGGSQWQLDAAGNLVAGPTPLGTPSGYSPLAESINQRGDLVAGRAINSRRS